MPSKLQMRHCCHWFPVLDQSQDWLMSLSPSVSLVYQILFHRHNFYQVSRCGKCINQSDQTRQKHISQVQGRGFITSAKKECWPDSHNRSICIVALLGIYSNSLHLLLHRLGGFAQHSRPCLLQLLLLKMQYLKRGHHDHLPCQLLPSVKTDLGQILWHAWIGLSWYTQPFSKHMRLSHYPWHN